MNTNITKTWKIEISKDEIFARCTNETLYQAYNRNEENPKGDAMVIQEDDKGQFRAYLSHAIANLHMVLARRMEEFPVDDGDTVTFVLHMHHNHEDNVLPMLIEHCYDYLKKKVLEQWYHADFGSELARLEVNHCIHYRKHPVRRMIDPLL